MRLEEIQRVPLIYGPTPVHPLRRLSAALGGVQVLCKRDDLTSLAMGGNKLRKLEFLLREALDQGADTVITTGAAQSNHARLTAAAASSLGLRSVLILRGPVLGQGQGNLLLDDLVGAEVRIQTWETWEEGNALLEQVADELRKAGHHPYVVPLGGSNALGALGYVLAAQELAVQTEEQPPVAVVCASSSGGTQAGLVLGKALFDLPFEVVGISVNDPADKLAAAVASIASSAAALVEAPPVAPAAVTVFDDYVGEGYGKLDWRTVEAIRMVARLEGVVLDPVYTGKAMAGLLDLAHQHRWKAGESVIFLHTGGVPALFAYWDALGST